MTDRRLTMLAAIFGVDVLYLDESQQQMLWEHRLVGAGIQKYIVSQGVRGASLPSDYVAFEFTYEDPELAQRKQQEGVITHAANRRVEFTKSRG